jgi:hypothetical protein
MAKLSDETQRGRGRAQAAGICCKIVDGKTCGRALRSGKCSKHKADIYSSMGKAAWQPREKPAAQ